MATDDTPGEIDLERDEWAGPNPTAVKGPPGAVALRGYLGGETDGMVRLWVSESEFVEIPKDMIRRRDRLPGEAGTRVWVDGGITLGQLQLHSAAGAEEFLGGPLSQEIFEWLPFSIQGGPDAAVVFTSYRSHTWRHVWQDVGDADRRGQD
jgi:hypothetical protein